MTEQEFQKQIWRPYDAITTTNGVRGKVLGVAFNTKSVRAYISGAPEWVKCELIETHTTVKGVDGSIDTFMEEMNSRLEGAQQRIDRLTEEKATLEEQLSKNRSGALLTQVNIVYSNLLEKKKRIERIEASLAKIEDVVTKIYAEQETEQQLNINGIQWKQESL